MRGIAFILVLGILGYAMGDAEMFGGNLVNGFNWINTLYWISATIVSVIAVGLVGVFTIGGGTVGAGSKLGSWATSAGIIGGGAIGVFIALLVVVFPIANLWLTYEIMDLIDVSAKSFSEIGEDAKTMVYVWMGLLVLSIGIGSKND